MRNTKLEIPQKKQSIITVGMSKSRPGVAFLIIGMATSGIVKVPQSHAAKRFFLAETSSIFFSFMSDFSNNGRLGQPAAAG